jgi:ribose-phosphate pyrophosphokinase
MQMDMKPKDILIFAGSGSRLLTAQICHYLHVAPGKNETIRFSEGTIFVRVLENVRGLHVYVVQTTVFPANDNFMELLFWIDALKRASAASVTAVIPYFRYGKGDKKDEPRVSIRARVCADAIEASGADRVVTMDIHSPQIQGFFRIPVDNLYALPVLCKYVHDEHLNNTIVVSPDAGFIKQARKYATNLGTSMAIVDKERVAHDEKAEALQIIGDVRGKTAIVVDHFVISGGTLVDASEKLMECGARAVYALITHGVLSKVADERIDQSPITTLVITDTVENQFIKKSNKIKVVTVAPLFGEAISRIHSHASISAMFPI